MLLTIDVGNTNIVYGIYEENQLIKYWRMSTDKSKTSDELGMFLNQLLVHDEIKPAEIKDIIISSVVPTIMYSLQHMALKYFGKEAMVVGPGIKTGMKILYDDPKQVGADRIVNAVAAFRKYGGPVIVVDFGTGTTFCAISAECNYMGGAIAPGIKISSDALFQKAAKLPRVELQMPTNAIARTTNESMQSGIIYGYVGLVDHMVKLFKKEMKDENARVVATGGLSTLISSKSKEIQIVDKFLTLDGLKMIYDMNKSRGKILLLNNVNIPSNLFLGPMAGVTDFAFRKICREFGLEMSYTEMVSSKGIYYKDKKTFQLLKINQGEHPIGVQIFGSDPYFMSESVLRIQNEIEYEVLDINMGCPTPKIVKNGDGSALLNYPQKAFDIVKAVVAVSEKPVTVKIRIGWDKVGEIVQFAKLIEEAGAVAITVHGRTRDQFYSGTADWDTIKLIKDALKIPVIGNGDIFTLQDAIDKQRESGVDGIMIARGAQGNPWLIKNIVHYNKTGKKLPDPSLEEVISVLFKHLAYSIESKGEHRGLIEMRKHVGWYIKGYKHASIVRNKINQATSVDEFRYCVNELLDNNK